MTLPSIPVRPGDGPDLAERVATAVLGVPGVAALHAGPFGAVATYLPGRQVAGVRVGPEGAEVHVALFWEAPVPATADAVRAAAAAVAPGPVQVFVEDLVPTDLPRTDLPRTDLPRN